VGEAVNVTFVPEQIGFDEAAIETLAGRFGFTVIVTVFDVAGLPVTQLREDVITQYTVLPFTNPEFEYVLLFVPTGLPFKYH
jgi:hypothetical protein